MSKVATWIRESIKTRGWHVIMVPEDEEGPGLAYSIGLFESFDHPEVILFGLPINPSFTIVNTIGDLVRGGGRFRDGDVSDDVLEGLPVLFRALSRSRRDGCLGQAINHYGGPEFPCLECRWPDADGRFPERAEGDLGAESGFDEDSSR